MSDSDNSVEEDTPGGDLEDEDSRLELVWRLLVFQFKLAVDGLRDLVLIPISLLAGVLGLIAGGSKPSQYLHKVMQFGRQTESWINLFGHREQAGTSDELLDPLKDKLLNEAKANPWMNKAGTSINRSLDQVEQAIGEVSRKSTRQADADIESDNSN